MESVVIDREKIGQKIKELRESENLSQADFAEQIGEDRRKVWQYEKGIALTLENIAQIAKFYRKPIEFFLDN